MNAESGKVQKPVDLDALFSKAEGAARMLCMTGDPVFRRHLADLAEGRKAVAALAEALKDSLEFVQRHSYRWDGASDSATKHPQAIVESAIAALKAAGVATEGGLEESL